MSDENNTFVCLCCYHAIAFDGAHFVLTCPQCQAQFQLEMVSDGPGYEVVPANLLYRLVLIAPPPQE